MYKKIRLQNCDNFNTNSGNSLHAGGNRNNGDNAGTFNVNNNSAGNSNTNNGSRLILPKYTLQEYLVTKYFS